MTGNDEVRGALLAADERAAAEQEYTAGEFRAFDYESAPVGSRDWTLFWKGWQARSRLQSPPSVSGEWIAELKEALRSYGPEHFPALRRVAAAQWESWLPIEGAPKDRLCFVWNEGWIDADACWWDAGRKLWREHRGDAVVSPQPTRFYPIPPPHAAPVSNEGETK